MLERERGQYYGLGDREPLLTAGIGEWEHTVIESVKSVIPESVSTTWHDWRKSLKKAEHDLAGSDDFSEGVEMAGWGVEEAEKQNKAEASKCHHTGLFPRSIKARKPI